MAKNFHIATLQENMYFSTHNTDFPISNVGKKACSDIVENTSQKVCNFNTT